MHHNKSQAAFDRDGIIRMLWADPVARLAFRSAPRLMNRGDEYIDLQRLAAGVQIATRCKTPTGGELSRESVTPHTWTELLRHLEE